MADNDGPRTINREDAHWIAQQAHEVIRQAIHGTPESTTEAVFAIAMRYGDTGLYGLACSLAEAARAAIGIPRGDGTLEGLMVGVAQQDDDDPASLWASQFVAAYINGDRTTCAALWTAEMLRDGDGDDLGGLAALIGATKNLLEGLAP